MIERLFLSPLRIGAATVLATVAMATLEWTRWRPVEPEEFEAFALLFRRLLTLGLILGGGVAALDLVLVRPLEVLTRSRGRRWRLLPALVLALLLWPATASFADSILGGPGISQWSGIGWLRALAPVVFSLLWFLLLALTLGPSAGFAGKISRHGLVPASGCCCRGRCQRPSGSEAFSSALSRGPPVACCRRPLFLDDGQCCLAGLDPAG